MNNMKVVELINKMAKNEIEAGTKIIFHDNEYEVINKSYGIEIKCACGQTFEEEHNVFNCLNDEIEIIEEDKPIEKIRSWYGCEHNFEDSKEYIDDNFKSYYNKINEIIDKLNKEK